MTVPIVQRVKRWLAAQLGTAYAPTVDTVDRAVNAFLAVFGASFFAADVIRWPVVLDASVWERAGLAALTAVVNAVRALLFRSITGDPGTLSVVSRTLRARREVGQRGRPQHHVPVVAPRRAA